MTNTQTRDFKPSVSPEDAIVLLARQYGPVEWAPRYDPISELVNTILSQHTSDINSERAFRNLRKRFESFETVAAVDVKEIEEVIRPAGLFRIKASRIKAVLNDILDEVGSLDLSFLSEMPLDDAKIWLRKLNGIGPKTAAIILCFAFGMPAMPVDTHIYRISKRLGFIGSKVSADQAHEILESQVPSENVFAFHMYLISHGRQVCKALRPRCDKCVLAWGCPSSGKFRRSASSTLRNRSN